MAAEARGGDCAGACSLFSSIPNDTIDLDFRIIPGHVTEVSNDPNSVHSYSSEFSEVDSCHGGIFTFIEEPCLSHKGSSTANRDHDCEMGN